MESLTIQNHHPPNDPADFVASRAVLPGVPDIHYNAEKDQMQVGTRPSDHGALAESVDKSQAVEHKAADVKYRLDSWADATDERDKLLTVLEEFQSKQKVEVNGKKINIHTCSWPEVMVLIKRAEDQYKNEKITGVLGHLRKCLRKLGDNGEVFEDWLRILPDGDYGSIISGSFHVIIQVSLLRSILSKRHRAHLL